jgi:predicted metal-dependent enzyme (double-stranded beta helix superfamily)
MHASDLVSLCAEAASKADPMAAVRGVLETLKSDLDRVARAIDYLPGTGGNARQAFFRSPNLSLLKVRFPSGRRTPPHNHGTWATILVLSGSEKNTLYGVEADDSLRLVSEVELHPGSILPMRSEAVHVAECTGAQPAIGLHVYGGDVLGLARSMWDPDTLARHELDWNQYEGFAERASSAERAPLTSG